MIRAKRMVSKPRACYILTGLGFTTHNTFIYNTFISNMRLKMGAKAKQHPESDLLTGRK